MFRNCCVDGCESVRSKILFHCFPSSNTPAGRERVLKWLRRFKSDELRLMDFETIQKLYICNLHFENKFIKNKVRLHPGGYPNLFTEQEIKTGVPDIPISTDEDDRKKGVKTDHSNYTKHKHEDITAMQKLRKTPIPSIELFVNFKTSTLYQLCGVGIRTEKGLEVLFCQPCLIKNVVFLESGCTPCEVPQVLHGFPNPEKDTERFNLWLRAIGGHDMGLEADHVYKYRRVCRIHFEARYLCRNNRISNIAVPTLHLSVCYGVPVHRFPNPVKHPELYTAWVKIIDKKLMESDPMKVYKSKRVCDHHFDPIYKLSVSRLKRTSIPSINLHRIRRTNLTFVEIDHSYSAIIREYNDPTKLKEMQRETVATYNIVIRGDTAFKKEIHQKIIKKKLQDAEVSETEEPADEPAVDDDDFKIPSPRMVPSPVPSMENESKEEVFSWQKSELIPADEVDAPLTAAELEEKSGISLYCDETPAPQVPETSVKEVEYRCKDCGEVINGFQFWCVQCFGCALCGACEARGEHNRHYVLRAPPHRPYRQTQLVLATIRHQLQNENMLTNLGADNDRPQGHFYKSESTSFHKRRPLLRRKPKETQQVKLEVKEEPPEEEWRILDPAPAHNVASDDDPLRDESFISDDGLHPCKRPRLTRGEPLSVTVTSRPRPQEQVLINLDTRDQIEFIAEPEDVAVDDTEDHLDDSVDSSVHEDDAVSIDSRIDEDEVTRIEKDNVTRDECTEEHLDDESVDSSVHDDDAVSIDSRIDEDEVTRIEKDNVTRDECTEEHLDDESVDSSVHEDDAVSIDSRIDEDEVTRIEKDNVIRDEYTEEHLDDESVDSSVHEYNDVSIEETEVTRIEEENVIRDTEEHLDNEDSVVTRIDETEIARIEDETDGLYTIVETIEHDDGNVLEDDTVSILYTFEDDTLVISSDQIEIIRLEDDTDCVVGFESILSDIDRTVRREDDTRQLPVRGPPEAMLRTLPAEAVVELQPLSSSDIRKWTAHSMKRRK